MQVILTFVYGSICYFGNLTGTQSIYLYMKITIADKNVLGFCNEIDFQYCLPLKKNKLIVPSRIEIIDGSQSLYNFSYAYRPIQVLRMFNFKTCEGYQRLKYG